MAEQKERKRTKEEHRKALATVMLLIGLTGMIAPMMAVWATRQNIPSQEAYRSVVMGFDLGFLVFLAFFMVFIIGLAGVVIFHIMYKKSK